MTDLSEFFDQSKEKINARLCALIPHSSDQPYAALFSAARYSLLSSAKRLRPLLVLATVQSYHQPIEIGLDPACALEMVHTYSLIHDDLPCMDDDDFRRGQPTLHKVYPESHAVLTGDYLLTHAFHILAESPGLTDTQKLSLVRSLSKHAGSEGMIGGQVIDLHFENKQIDLSTLELMHAYKTASLITAALEFGGIIGNAPANDLTTLSRIGGKIGIAFQLIDDLLDVTGTLEQMGKSAGSDQASQKSTALSLMSIPDCRHLAEQLLTSALTDLDTLPTPTPLLSHLFQCLVFRDR